MLPECGYRSTVLQFCNNKYNSFNVSTIRNIARNGMAQLLAGLSLELKFKTYEDLRFSNIANIHHYSSPKK